MITDSNITLTTGDTEIVVIPVRDGDLTTDDSDPVYRDLEDVRIDYVIADSHADEDIVWQAAEADIDVVPFGDLEATDSSIPDTQRVITISLSRDQTATLAPGEYVHECQVVDQEHREATVMQGSVTVRESATVETDTEGWTPI